MSVSMGFGSGRARSRVSIIVAVLVFAVLAAVGLRFVPDAAAAEPETEEVGDFIFEISADNILGITNKTARVRMDDNLDAVPEEGTEEEMNALLTEVRDQFEADFGWDLTAAADRASVRQEIHSLSQALFSIPDATLADEEYASLRALRDIVAEAEGSAECRDRCLPENRTLVNFIISAGFGASVSKLLAEFTVPGLGSRATIFGVGVYIAALTWFYTEVAPVTHGVSSTAIRSCLIFSIVQHLAMIKDLRKNAVEVAENISETIPEAVKEAAAEIESLTPTEAPNESANDYDMINDEL